MTDQSQPDATPSERRLDGLMHGLRVLRVPLAMGLLTVLVLTVPDQVREIYRILAQERADDYRGYLDPHSWLALASLVALSLVLWQTARKRAEELGWIGAQDAAPQPRTQWMLIWGPRAIATLPLLGAALGSWLSRSGRLEISEKEIEPSLYAVLKLQEGLAWQFDIAAAVCVAVAAVIFIMAAVFERKLAPVGSRSVRRVAFLNNWLLFPPLILGSIILLIYYPVILPQRIGTIPIFALWMASLAVVFALLSTYSRLVGFPILGAIVVLLIVLELSGRSDNHMFRHEVKSPAIQRPGVKDAFLTWVKSRADLESYRKAGKAYPVYIVAAEGGGLYAAFQTAKLLSRMQDLCSSFSQHVFSISAVSGGSLGAAVFAGLTQDLKNEVGPRCLQGLSDAGPVEKAAGDALSRDLLSPVIWATLFPDFLQRFTPHPFSRLDRGYALELALENTWTYAGAKGANYLEGSFFQRCGATGFGCFSGATPSLALNVTNVETGMQMVLSQINFENWPLDQYPKILDTFASGADAVDMSVSTAVGLSARFPWISPAGWYKFPNPPEEGRENPRKRRMSFVDGGYVDSSGVVTASKLARVLGKIAADEPGLPALNIKLIVISAAWMPFERFWIDPPEEKGMSEYVSPFVAALAAWQGRGFSAQSDIVLDLPDKVINMGVYYNFMPLPVGWHLSGLSRRYIEQFKGHPDKCDRDKARPNNSNHATMANSFLFKANCAAAEIVNDLTLPASAAVQGAGKSGT
jgi:hypothetical protein